MRGRYGYARRRFRAMEPEGAGPEDWRTATDRFTDDSQVVEDSRRQDVVFQERLFRCRGDYGFDFLRNTRDQRRRLSSSLARIRTAVVCARGQARPAGALGGVPLLFDAAPAACELWRIFWPARFGVRRKS